MKNGFFLGYSMPKGRGKVILVKPKVEGGHLFYFNLPITHL
jgi:hypothetical protein